MQPLAVVGNVNADLILGPVTPWPAAGSEIIVDHNELRVGGAAGNSAQAWAALGLDHQIAASTGDDQFGIWLRAAFKSRSRRWPVAPGSTTLSVGISHPDSERTFFTTSGHLEALNWPQVRDMLDWPKLAGGYLLLCGCFLTDTLAAQYDALFARAEAHSIRIALDTGWPLTGWTEAIRARVRRWLSHSACLLMNEVEAAMLAERTSPEQAGAELLAMMPPGGLVVIKRGARGALALNGAGSMISIGAPRVPIIDTIGAGDVFNAAFLGGLAAERPLEEALRHGVVTASRAISTHPRRYLDPQPQEFADEHT